MTIYNIKQSGLRHGLYGKGVTYPLFPKLRLLTIMAHIVLVYGTITTTYCLHWCAPVVCLTLTATPFIMYKVDSLGLDPGSLIYGDTLLSEHFVVTNLIACTWWLKNHLTSNATYINTIIGKIHKSTYMTHIHHFATSHKCFFW